MVNCKDRGRETEKGVDVEGSFNCIVFKKILNHVKLLLFKIYIYICDSEQYKNDQDKIKTFLRS